MSGENGNMSDESAVSEISEVSGVEEEDEMTSGGEYQSAGQCIYGNEVERFYCVVGANVVKPPLSSQFFIVAVVRVRDSVEGNRTTTSSSRCE